MQTGILEAFNKSKISVSVFFVVMCAISGVTTGLHIAVTSHSFASAPTPPTISISEIMSCPTTGNKEWVELQRSQDSSTQLPNSAAFSLAGYQLEDDKAIIWTGTEVVPEPGPVTGGAADPISSSIGGYFAANDPYTTITFNKHYLNNTGDILKLWSPAGELLEQVTIPACSENGKSWTFQDGDWQPANPTPGQVNPQPSPAASPQTTPSPSSTPNAIASPTPKANPVASPSTNTTSTQQTTSENTIQISNTTTDDPNNTKNNTVAAIPHPASYIAKINQTNRSEQSLTKQIDENTAPQILGTTHESPSQVSTASANMTSKPSQQTEYDHYNHNLLYSPDRSIFGYLSAILGGALVTAAAAGLLAYRASQAQTHTNTNNTSPSVALTL